MGEKGNVLGGASEVIAAAAPGESLIERVTTTTTETVVGVGEDLAGTIRDKAIGAVADESVAAARQRLQKPDGETEATDPGAPPGNPGPA